MLYIGKFAVCQLGDVVERRPDEMLHAAFLLHTVSTANSTPMRRGSHLCEISDVPALSQLKLGIHLLPVVGHSENGISSLESRLDLILRVDVCSHTLNTFGCQGLRIGLGGVARDAADLEFAGGFRVAQDRLDNRASLISSGTKDDENFLFSHNEESLAELTTREHTFRCIYQSCRLAGKYLVAAFSALGLFRSCRDASRSD